MKKLTVKDLFDLKSKRQLTEVFVSTTDEARACEAAGIDLLVTVNGEPLRAVRAGAPHTFITGALLYGQVFSETDAIKQGFEGLRGGADAIYACMSPEWIRAMARQGIPVVGHVGFVPQRSSWFGGFKAVGKTADEAMRVYEATLAHEEAGAIGVEMEIVPHRIAAEIAKRVKILVISMGSGAGCDAQYLFACDILGQNKGHVPRHARVYADLHTEMQRVQDLRVGAFRGYKKDVDAGTFAGPNNTITIAEPEFEKFLKTLDKG